jgi:hypothetical protein
MKIGDMVVSRKSPYLQKGLIIEESSWFDDYDYWWVLFEGCSQNEKWCHAHDLQVINESR